LRLVRPFSTPLDFSENEKIRDSDCEQPRSDFAMITRQNIEIVRRSHPGAPMPAGDAQRIINLNN
jgi:hypothetical protein